jgi:thiol-disulfide isomerase/thioredoxin
MEQFNETLPQIQDLAILYFSGATCGPCRKVAPLLEELAETYEPDVSFYKVQAPKLLPAFVKYQVVSVPTVLMLMPNKYGNAEDPEVKAKLLYPDITKDNLIGLISEYKNKILK